MSCSYHCFAAALFLSRKGRAHVTCLHLCLKSTTCKPLRNLIRVAVVTQISDPVLQCPFPFHPSSKNRGPIIICQSQYDTTVRHALFICNQINSKILNHLTILTYNFVKTVDLKHILGQTVKRNKKSKNQQVEGRFHFLIKINIK